jgi:hypothetical protein
MPLHRGIFKGELTVDKKILRLVDYSKDAKTWSAREMLNKADLMREETDRKGLVILCDESGNPTQRFAAGLNRLEVMGLCALMIFEEAAGGYK